MSEAQKPVLFVTLSPSTWPLVQPLYTAGFDIVVPSRQEAQSFKQMTVGALEDLCPEPLAMAAASGATILAAQLANKLGTGEIQKTWGSVLDDLASCLNGAGGMPAPHEAVLPHVTQWFPGWVHQSLTRQLLLLQAMETMLRLRNVRGVVVHNDVEEFTKCLCLFAAAHNIPSVHVPHAIYLDWQHGPFMYDVHDVVTADWVCCAGWFQAEWYKARGARRLAITGVPRWDRHAQGAAKKDRSLACRRLKLDESRPVVVYYSSWRQETAATGFHNGIEVSYRAMLKLAEEAHQVKTYQLVVKTHPHARIENMDWHGRLAADLGVPCLITDRYLELCLQAADLCVVYGSSGVAMENAIYGVPVVSIQGYADDEAVITCNDTPDSLRAAIAQGLSDSWRQRYEELRPRFVEKYAGRVDGESTRRVVEHIMRLAKKSE